MLRALPALFVAMLVLAGCGTYRPLYGTGPNGLNTATGLAQISVPEQHTRAGQLLRNELLDGVGSSGVQRFSLKLDVTEKTYDFSAITSISGTRKRYALSAHYVLMDSGSGKALTSGDSFSNVSFDVINQPVSDLSAADNARMRAAKELGQDIKLRLAAFISGQSS